MEATVEDAEMWGNVPAGIPFTESQNWVPNSTFLRDAGNNLQTITASQPKTPGSI
jgi:hypothetical protein